MELKKLQALYGLKWNPFAEDLPAEALQTYPKFDFFCGRVEDLVLDGGYAACMGDPGLGKSAILRMLSERLSLLPNVTVGEFTRPQASVTDFYRELSALFLVPLQVSNRYGAHRALRAKWHDHIKTTCLRPVLLMDEAQHLNLAALRELKSMSSERFDSQMLLTVILAGDLRLSELLKTPELKPIDSRIRQKLILGPWETEDLAKFLQDAIRLAGAPSLMTPDLIHALADKALGNLRTLMHLCGDCLALAVHRELPRLDEKLLLELIGPTPKAPTRRPAPRILK